MKRKNAELLGPLLRRYLRLEGLETPLNELHIVSAWADVVGRNVAAGTSDLYVRNGVLHVSLRSPALKANMMMMRRVLVKRLNDYVGADVITDIVFR